MLGGFQIESKAVDFNVDTTSGRNADVSVLGDEEFGYNVI